MFLIQRTSKRIQTWVFFESTNKIKHGDLANKNLFSPRNMRGLLQWGFGQRAIRTWRFPLENGDVDVTKRNDEMRTSTQLI